MPVSFSACDQHRMSTPGRLNWTVLRRGPVLTIWRWTDPSQSRLFTDKWHRQKISPSPVLPDIEHVTSLGSPTDSWWVNMCRLLLVTESASSTWNARICTSDGLPGNCHGQGSLCHQCMVGFHVCMWQTEDWSLRWSCQEMWTLSRSWSTASITASRGRQWQNYFSLCYIIQNILYTNYYQNGDMTLVTLCDLGNMISR